MPSAQIVDKIREEILESGFDDRYKLGAYEFVLNGLDFFLSKLGEKRHVSGQELSLGLLSFAEKQYGPLAKSVLDRWGITQTEDFGYIVYNMISVGMMSKQPEDSLDDFFGVTELDSYFEGHDYFEIDRSYIKRIKGA
ncbi:MAG: Minf_1886 family protein [Chitinispirillaceae bacterium]